MGVAVGGKMKQKIYADTIPFQLYDTNKNIKRIFINIANGVMWNKITGKGIPESPITMHIYKRFNYPWFKLYDETLEDVKGAKEFGNIQSINAIQKEKEGNHDVDGDDEVIDMGTQNVYGIQHPQNNVEDGDW